MIFAAATAILFGLLAAIALADARNMRIPDALNATLVVCGLAATWLLDRSLSAALIGACMGYAVLYGLNIAYRHARGRDGLGMGDAKLAAGGGAWLGWAGLPYVVLIGSALGIVWVAAQRLRGKHIAATDALAFGPFLCLGIAAVWLVQNLA